MAKQSKSCKFVVTAIGLEKNQRGEMCRRVTFKAIPSEPMGDLPDGFISGLFLAEFGARFDVLGQEVFVIFRADTDQDEE